MVPHLAITSYRGPSVEHSLRLLYTWRGVFHTRGPLSMNLTVWAPLAACPAVPGSPWACPVAWQTSILLLRDYTNGPAVDQRNDDVSLVVRGGRQSVSSSRNRGDWSLAPKASRLWRR